MLYRLDVKAFKVQNAFTTFKPKSFLNLANELGNLSNPI